jgi:hypothetical protein
LQAFAIHVLVAGRGMPLEYSETMSRLRPHGGYRASSGREFTAPQFMLILLAA